MGQWWHSQVFFGKKIGRPEKTTLLFLLPIQKKRQHKKHPFSELVEISRIENRKKGQTSLIRGPPTPKSFWENFKTKEMGSPEILVGGPLITILGHFFEKPVSSLLIFQILAVIYRGKLLKSRILRQKPVKKACFFRIWGSMFENKARNRRWMAPDRENYFPQTLDTKHVGHQKFRSGPPGSTFQRLFLKKRFSDLFF